MKKNIKIIITCLSLFLFLGLFSMNSTEAATQTIKSTIRSEKFETQPNGQKLWAWGFNVKTTNVEDGTPLWVYVYNGKIEDKILVSSGTYTTITNNSAITETKYVLEEGKFYTILLQVPTKPTMGTMYSATVGKADDGSSVNNIIPKEEQIYSEGYNLLAPIGSIKKVETDDVGKYFNIIFKIVIALCAVLAVIYIVIGGVQYMGDESIFAKTEAKKNILSAIFGLLIALGSYALLNTINPDLLGGDGLNIKTVTAEIVDLPDAGDGNIDPDFKSGKTGSYAMDDKISPGVVNAIEKLKDGWEINQFRVYTNNRMLISIKKGSEIDNSNIIDIKPGINGFAPQGTAKAGDKKTPIGSWKILGIKTSNNGQPVYNKQGANMGASFWLLNPMNNGERGIGMHGNKNGNLSETYGCIRVKNADLLALLPYVKVGTMVYIGN